MTTTRIISLDLGLASTGIAIIDPDGASVDVKAMRVVAGEVWRSKSGSGADRQALSKVCRARTLATVLLGLIDKHDPQLVVGEELAYHRGVHANVGAGLVWGTVAGVCQARNLPLYSVRVNEWRKAARLLLALPSDAHEGTIHHRLGVRIPGARRVVNSVKTPSARVHLWDAIGVGLWAVAGSMGNVETLVS